MRCTGKALGGAAICCGLIVAMAAAEVETAFEVEVSGDIELHWQGEDATFRRAIHDPSSGDRQLRIELDPGGKNQQVVFQINVGDTAAGDEEGTYEVGKQAGGQIPSMASILCEGACDDLMIPIAGADIGMVVIESAEAEVVEGTFEFRAEGRRLGDRVLQPAFAATGRFRASLIE